MKNLIATLILLISTPAFTDTQVVYNFDDSQLSTEVSAFFMSALKEHCQTAIEDGRIEFRSVEVQEDEVDQGVLDIYYTANFEVMYDDYSNDDDSDYIQVVVSEDFYAYDQSLLLESVSSTYGCN